MGHHTGQRETSSPGPSDAGAVVLDIGPGAGAVVLRTGRHLCGREIEIRRAGTTWTGQHVAVRERTGAGASQFAAIFGGLAEGRYELRVSGGGPGSPSLFVDVPDAEVTVADWPGNEVLIA